MIGGGLVAAIVAASALVLFQPWKLVVDDRVDEAAPVPAAAPAEGGRASAGATPATPAPAARLLHRTSTWKAYEHETAGTVKVYRLADGRRVLRLEDFTTSNGPDVKVWLSTRAYSAGDFSSGHLNLGTLKGNQGSSNYEIPADADLERYESVVIWCKRFSVAFAAAPLTSAA
ncbi:DM13 domain-containing protein [Actinomadura alba]|uniref:DM13 domain-containing protein n=1 Tax=Actinomadura alba TaxID=406431 RepID=A0ABR7LI06_9ACTN|nr:DM13 domain-containing protein [Actinomadura alba]